MAWIFQIKKYLFEPKFLRETNLLYKYVEIGHCIIGEHPIRSEKTRHMVTAIHNITRDMQTISCYVDNAFGTPMRATRTIKIERIPRVKLHPKNGRLIASVGADIRIECEAGKMTYFWKNNLDKF